MSEPIQDIARRRLGRTGLRVSEIGLGGAWLQGRHQQNSLEAGAAAVKHALERGMNYVDTAECYGESERVVGLALEGYEGECILATKFGHIPEGFDFSRRSVLDSVQRSRERLRYRPIDLLQLHTPPEPDWERLLGPDGALEGMREAQKRGWCRFLGTTGNSVDFLRRCVETDLFDTMLVFLRYDLLDHSADTLIEDAFAQDVGVILASPLRMGLFGAARDEMVQGLSAEEEHRLIALEALFAEEPGGITGGAMRFALSHPLASIVLAGATSAEDVDATLAGSRAPLTPQQMQVIYGDAK